MPLFSAPMYLDPPPATARRYRGIDFARRDPGYGARYARRATPAPLSTTVSWPAWPACTLAQVGDAWVLQERALAA